MTGSAQVRAGLTEARRVVIKIGSRYITESDERFGIVAAELAAQRQAGRSVVLVSSGAVALGCRRLGLGERPKDIARLQAAAACGQARLMQAYEEALAKHGAAVAQVLLTHADLADRDRYLNARAAIDAVIAMGAVPIINENDTVAVEEIKFGDNDQLAAMVSALIGADLLLLLTDVDGVLDDEGELVPVVHDPADVLSLVRPKTDAMSVGGMASKLESVRLATRRGVPVVIANAANDQVVNEIVAGDEVGTLFLPRGMRMASRKHWIAFTLKAKGAIVVDGGAAKAVVEHKRSLLPAGVVGVRGAFDPGDAVAIVGPDGQEIARGLARYGIRDVALLAGAKTSEIERRLGHYGGEEIVHRNDLVVGDVR